MGVGGIKKPGFIDGRVKEPSTNDRKCGDWKAENT